MPCSIYGHICEWKSSCTKIGVYESIRVTFAIHTIIESLQQWGYVDYMYVYIYYLFVIWHSWYICFITLGKCLWRSTLLEVSWVGGRMARSMPRSSTTSSLMAQFSQKSWAVMLTVLQVKSHSSHMIFNTLYYACQYTCIARCIYLIPSPPWCDGMSPHVFILRDKRLWKLVFGLCNMYFINIILLCVGVNVFEGYF